MDQRIRSGELTLAAHLALPSEGSLEKRPAVVLCHGYPSGPGGARAAVSTFPELADRIAGEMGWVALAPALRGCEPSGGDFSLRGWLEDLRASIEHLAKEYDTKGGVWVAGFGTGGALAICAGAEDERVRGVASLAAPADFDDWAGNPRRLLQHARELGIVRPATPVATEEWQRDLRSIQAVRAAQVLAPRPLLLVHGSDDELVPPFDARVIGDSHGEAELRMIQGGSHQLRHDPRAVAVLLGWLDRQRHEMARRPTV